MIRGLALLTAAAILAGCASTTAPIAPPRLQMPPTAQESCALYLLPPSPTVSDLEVGFATRGAQLVDCDGRRRLAVETAQAEHEVQDRWLAPPPARGWWPFGRGLNHDKSAAAAGSRP
jgi:hypothetical protein